ncbi:hypothetical protein B277_16084 [Janibacter hoylei PVAS-1]|uniref:DUF418 domain-containing protein n=1 Tax=Janibacter hoylei PVAS-1 TaxID=1210046 RepID=K1EKI2_9MICO|nr:DUF418 domain-containing protein [Janibacter hoylei]EKA59833.1 hypothetical protein B277_16084 [Janibacter hoylei PVAS-1]RWU84518.1 hypothetical protein CWN80_05100 [Janibacter hoylei PVAS-1]
MDLARGLAGVGMILSHVSIWARDAPVHSGAVGVLLGQFTNMAAPTFALLMGVSVGLVSQRPGAVSGQLVRRDWVRGVIYIVLGLLLARLHTPIAIVLHFLGATLVFGTVLARLSTRWLLPLTVVLAAVGPWVNARARAALSSDLGWLHDYPLTWLTLSPSYQVTTILPIFCAGVLVSRWRLSARSLLVLAGVGAVAYAGFLLLHVTGMGQQHPGTYYDFLGNIGRSFIGTAVVVIVGDRLHGTARRLVRPLTAMGAMSLSAYVLQVLLFVALLRVADSLWLVTHWWVTFVGVPLCVMAAAWAWQTQWGRGPLERGLRLLTQRVP